MNALTVCSACEAAADVCQLKRHFSGRACCADCDHRDEDR